MVGRLQDIVTAAVVIGAADQTKSGGSTRLNDSSKITQRLDAISGTQNRVVVGTGGLKVSKVNDIDNLFEKDDDFVSEDDFKLEPGTLDEETVSLMTDAFNELMSKIDCNIEFNYHKEVNLMSIKMVDKRTNEVIKEFPPEEMIENMVRAKDWLGAFIDKNM